MSNLCIICYVFGDKYQIFIPLFALSLIKAYPEYDIRLYLDREICLDVKEQMQYLDEYTNLTIIENVKFDSLCSKALQKSQIQKSLRWIHFDPVFMNYDAVYIGDIDMLIFKEEQSIYEQHMIHCDIIKAPYSNILRKFILKKNIINTLCILYKCGFENMCKFLFNNDTTLYKMSGLHFVKSPDYFNTLQNNIDYFINELNMIANNKSKENCLYNFNNEAFLYKMLQHMNITIPKLTITKDYNISANPYINEYRPHHGIHLGIFRNKTLMKSEKDIISSDVYINYYKQFTDLKSNDIYKKIENNFSPYIKDIIQRMEFYYDNLEK